MKHTKYIYMLNKNIYIPHIYIRLQRMYALGSIQRHFYNFSIQRLSQYLLSTNCHAIVGSADINLLLKQTCPPFKEIFSTRKNSETGFSKHSCKLRSKRDMIHTRFNLAPTKLTGRHFVRLHGIFFRLCDA